MKDLLAAFTFFTRLPFWRLSTIPADSFKRMVCYWPMVGWLTGGLMAGVFWIATQFFSNTIAVLLTFISRLLLTGALHEDGLADFIDGMGGGRTRTRILEIMKDSSIGSYGVLGLILYVALWVGSVVSLSDQLPVSIVCVCLFTGDIWSKWCASQLINLLPYARKESESKNKTVYERMPFPSFFRGATCALFPFFLLMILRASGCFFVDYPWWFGIAYLTPIITMGLLVIYMRKRIKGYTGDCCGATFLFCELLYLLTIPILWKFI